MGKLLEKWERFEISLLLGDIVVWIGHFTTKMRVLWDFITSMWYCGINLALHYKNESTLRFHYFKVILWHKLGNALQNWEHFGISLQQGGIVAWIGHCTTKMRALWDFITTSCYFGMSWTLNNKMRALWVFITTRWNYSMLGTELQNWNHF